MSRWRVLASFSAFALAVACSDAPRAATEPLPQTPVAPVAARRVGAPPVPKVATSLTETAVRVASLTGAPQRAGRAIAVGDRVEGGATLVLVAGDGLELDVAQSGRLSVEGPATLQLGTEAAAQVLVAIGVFTVIVPPAGDGKLIPQRLATPHATFTFRPGTTSVVAIDRAGAVLVHVISGRAEVVPVRLVAETDDLFVDTRAGKRFDDKGVASLKPAEDLNMAILKARAFARAASKGATRDDRFELAQQALNSALSELAHEVEQGKRVEAQHKAAVASADTATRLVQQRELAAHGQRLFRLKRVVLAAWERVQVVALLLAPEDATTVATSMTRLRERVRPVLPR